MSSSIIDKSKNNTEKTICYPQSLNIMINLHLIREVYRELNATDRKNYPMEGNFYKTIMDISRPRYDRICKAQGFFLPDDLAGRLSKKFGIDIEYFKEKGKTIEIYGLNELDWKCFLYDMYVIENEELRKDIDKNINELFEQSVEDKKLNSKEKDIQHDVFIKNYELEAIKKVSNAINEAVKDRLFKSTNELKDTLFKVYYYLRYNNTYVEKSRYAKIIFELKRLKIQDWDEILGDREKIVECIQLLDKNSDYLKAILTVMKHRN